MNTEQPSAGVRHGFWLTYGLGSETENLTSLFSPHPGWADQPIARHSGFLPVVFRLFPHSQEILYYM